MNHLARARLLSIGALFVAGCAGLPSYQGPESGPVATVEFQALRPESDVHVYILKSEFCDAPSVVASIRAQDEKSLNVRVSALVPLVFGMTHAAFGERCGVTYQFQPQAGAEYTATWHMEGGRCIVRVVQNEISSPSQRLSRRVPSARMNPLQCFR